MLKRLIDIIISLLALIVLSPILALVAIIIKIDSPGPIFFQQDRIGRYGINFKILKFRTMKAIKQENSLKITVANDIRITRIGKYLRDYKIDELPQFINVLIGQMSLVGPRPEVEEYVRYYSKRDKELIFSIRPGITDLASIKFRNESEILAKETHPEEAYIKKVLPRKLKYYRFYVMKQSVILDFWIVWRTILAI